MTKEGWGKLIKQDEEQHKIILRRAEQEQQQDYAELQIINMAYSYPPHISSRQPSFRNSILPEAFADHEQSASSLKTSKLLQIVRRWKAAKGRKQATASPPPMQLRRSSTRPPSCSRLNLVPLRCLSVQLHSDDEDEEATHTHGFFTASNWSPRLHATQSQGTLPMRALSCPKLGSPLGSCTPFSSRHFNREEEELEYLRPYCGAQEEERIGSNSSSKGSSPSKLNLSKQPSTPKGYLALYVGEERRRFLVKASLINHPLFGLLLDKAKEEFGFEQKGPLNIPCEVAFFEHIMLLVESNDPFYRNADRATVLLHLNRNMATAVV
ncbi:hypothetical protein L7F22_050028 [Adiantum nelumboides]|nr:hypothetical protein [Adiantum nelumboides]